MDVPLMGDFRFPSRAFCGDPSLTRDGETVRRLYSVSPVQPRPVEASDTIG